MKTIRASEIGSFLFCQRAWWYQRQGLESANQEEIYAGSQLHRAHSRRVLASGILRGMAFLMLLACVALLAAYCTSRVIG